MEEGNLRGIPEAFLAWLKLEHGERCKLRYKPDGFAKQNGRGASGHINLMI